MSRALSSFSCFNRFDDAVGPVAFEDLEGEVTLVFSRFLYALFDELLELFVFGSSLVLELLNDDVLLGLASFIHESSALEEALDEALRMKFN